MRHIVSTERPQDFSCKMEAAGCYCLFEDKLLFLKREEGRPHPHTWCLPGGKLEKEETPRLAALRELEEEIGVKVEDARLVSAGALYMCLPEMDYIFHLFYTRFDHRPSRVLAEKEHREARWVTVEEAYKLPLIIGGKEALDYFKKLIL